MKRLIKNKRGQIPVISDIKDFIMGIWGNTPKPVQFIIFLLLLFVVGSIINWSLQVFGLFCDSSDHPVNIGLNIGNIGLILNKPSEAELNGSGLDSNRILPAGVNQRCSALLMAGSNITYVDNDSIKVLSRDQHFFSAKNFCNQDCVKVRACPEGSICSVACEGDVYPKNYTDIIFIYRWKCQYEFWHTGCEVPEGMFFNKYTGNFECYTQDCIDEALDDATKTWDRQLKELGAKYVYPEGTTTKYSYERFVGVTCKDLSIHLAVFGVDIFDYKLWVMLTLVIIMIYFYKNWQDK